MADFNTQTTTSKGTQPLFAPVLNRYLIRVAKPYLVFSQFGQKTKVPKGKGKTVHWDKYTPLPLAKTPLTEGVAPTGAALEVSRISAEPYQYGNYVATTDEFDFYKYDPSPEVLRLGEILAENSAETFDSLTCDVVAAGTNVQYAGGKASRTDLQASDVLTLADIKKAVRTLKNNRARTFDGKKYICILDPSTAHDLTNDTLWKDAKIRDPKDLYEGEIGEMFGVRFIETTETESELLAKYNKAGYMHCTSSTSGALTVVPDSTASPSETQIKVSAANAANCGSTTFVSGEYALKKDATNIHFAYVMGADAYGVTDPNENVETITHDKHSIGGPLDQWSTMGWKGHHLAKILVDEWLVRIECRTTA